MNEKLSDALNEISDKHIAEAVRPKKRRGLLYSAIAAVLAVVILALAVWNPLTVPANAIALAQYPEADERPDSDDYSDSDLWLTDLNAWRARQDTANAIVDDTKTQLSGFFTRATEEFLADAGGENRVYSPVNLYIGLAALAEVTGGESRRQILDTLGIPDMDTLRTGAGTVWEQVYLDNGKSFRLLSNSLWLDEGVTYHQETLELLAERYYASVYQEDLGSAEANKALRAWLNRQTGGLLKDTANSLSFDPDTVLALASTVSMQAKWADEFSRRNNTDGVFHGAAGDTDCTYMNKKQYQTDYYWGESYGAVALGLKDNSKMWFILPDEGKTVDDVLPDPGLTAAILGEETERRKYVKVNLSVPKFDIRSSMNLRDGLESMGIQDIFNPQRSDFTPAMPQEDLVYVRSVEQAARVAIDEDGVTAASYIVIPGAGAAAPPEEIIDFVLDRPFLFVITGGNDLPLFAGVVNQP